MGEHTVRPFAVFFCQLYPVISALSVCSVCPEHLTERQHHHQRQRGWRLETEGNTGDVPNLLKILYVTVYFDLNRNLNKSK